MNLMEIISLLVGIGLAYYMFRTLGDKLKKQVVFMGEFARKNNWQFAAAPDALPFAGVASTVGFRPKSVRVQYFVTGVKYDKSFELFLLVGGLETSARKTAIGYATIVRTRQPLDLPAALPADTYGFSEGEWHYIVYRANAMSEEQINVLLDLLR